MANFVDDLTVLPVGGVDWDKTRQAAQDLQGKVYPILYGETLFEGQKSFEEPVGLAKIPTAELPDPDEDNQGQLLYDVTSNTLKFSDGFAWQELGSGGEGGQWNVSGGGDLYVTGKRVGIGTGAPAEDLHLSSAGSSSIRIQRTGIDGGTPDSVDPWVSYGSLQIAGVNLPEVQWRWGDSVLTAGRKVMGLESSGTLATVSANVRGSAYENFIQDGSFHPFFRINSFPDGRIQFGAGGCAVLAGGVVRSSDVVTVTTPVEHHFRTGQVAKMYPGEPTFPGAPGDFTITVIDPTHFSYAQVGADGSSTVTLTYSTPPDVEYARDNGIAAILSAVEVLVRIGGGDKVHFQGNRVLLETGIPIEGTGALLLGADGNSPVEVLPNIFHVKEGFTFYNEGTYKSTGWFNGGGQVQTTQEVFIVGTGDGPKTSGLREINGQDWMRLLVKASGANPLTIEAGGSDTINGAPDIEIPGNAAATLVAVGTDWQVFYHPPLS